MAHNDVDLVVQPMQAPHQTIDREFSDAAGDKRGNIRLLETEHDRSFGLGQLSALENAADFANELGLENSSSGLANPRSAKTLPLLAVDFLGLLISLRIQASALAHSSTAIEKSTDWQKQNSGHPTTRARHGIPILFTFSKLR